MADLTPELLAQLERDVAGFSGRWEGRVDEEADSIVYIGDDGDEYTIATDVEIDDVAEPIARMLNAVPALVAAAKERDQLRRQIDGSSLGALRRQVAQLTAQRDRWRAEAETMRKEIFHHGEQVSVREAARRGTPLDGADARTLEAALAATERERDQWRDVAAGGAAAEKPLLVHIDRDGESLCGMELHHGAVPLTAERSEVTCIGCWILRDEEAVHAAAESAKLRAEVDLHDQQIAAIMDGTFAVGDGTAQKEIERLRGIIDAIADALHDATPWAVEDRGAVALRLAKQFADEIDRLHALEGAQLEQRAAEHSAAWEQHLQAHIGQQAKEIGQLHATIERIKAFVADNAIVNDIELESILKGETP